MITGIIDYGMALQPLVDAPRWYSTPGSDPYSLGDPFVVSVETRMPEEVQDGLRTLGHRVEEQVGAAGHGVVQLIQIDQETGVMRGASDPRGDGHAVAL